MWMTLQELEQHLGAQVRDRRLRADLTVDEVASRAEVSAKTVQNLEHGRGSTLSTLIKVLRALDAEDWLETLAPPEPISPVAVLDAVRTTQRRQRARGSRG